MGLRWVLAPRRSTLLSPTSAQVGEADRRRDREDARRGKKNTTTQQQQKHNINNAKTKRAAAAPPRPRPVSRRARPIDRAASNETDERRASSRASLALRRRRGATRTPPSWRPLEGATRDPRAPPPPPRRRHPPPPCRRDVLRGSTTSDEPELHLTRTDDEPRSNVSTRTHHSTYFRFQNVTQLSLNRRSKTNHSTGRRRGVRVRENAATARRGAPDEGAAHPLRHPRAFTTPLWFFRRRTLLTHVTSLLGILSDVLVPSRPRRVGRLCALRVRGPAASRGAWWWPWAAGGV